MLRIGLFVALASMVLLTACRGRREPAPLIAPDLKFRTQDSHEGRGNDGKTNAVLRISRSEAN